MRARLVAVLLSAVMCASVAVPGTAVTALAAEDTPVEASDTAVIEVPVGTADPEETDPNEADESAASDEVAEVSEAAEIGDAVELDPATDADDVTEQVDIAEPDDNSEVTVDIDAGDQDADAAAPDAEAEQTLADLDITDSDEALSDQEDDQEAIVSFGETLPEFDGEELANAYVSQMFGLDEEDSEEEHGVLRWGSLDDCQKEIYDAWKKMFRQVAAGEQSSTTVTLWIKDYDAVDNLIALSNKESYQYNLRDYLGEVYLALYYDCPYEFYWYANEQPAYGMTTMVDSASSAGRRIAKFIFYFNAASDYCQSSYYTSSNADTNKTGAAARAVANAQSIVTAAKDKDLYNALLYFKNKICELASYNESAETSSPGTMGNNPWSLVYVFDNDASTKVTSEGYAKAFKYLCDQWNIKARNADCYLVSGAATLSSKSRDWMWNVVQTGYGNYVVDVTACDYMGTDLLFMKVPSAIAKGTHDGVSRTTGYTYLVGSASGTYAYDSDTLDTYKESEIGISANAYLTDKASGAKEQDTGNKAESYDVTFTGWKTENGKSYWYEKGIKQGTTGRGKEIYDPDSDAWYWLDAVQGGAKAVSKDVYQESNGGKWVRYDADGHMVKGWQTTSAGTYYFDLTTGAMAKGKVTVDQLPCWFDENTGIGKSLVWEQANGQDYYWYENGQRQGYDPKDKSYRGKEIYDPAQNAWFWLDNNGQGKKAVSKDVYQPYTYQGKDTIGKWVRYDATGRMIKGWSSTSKGKYYFDTTTGAMAKGPVKVSGKYYYFNSSTGIQQSGSYADRMTYAAQVVELVNNERAKQGIAPVTIDALTMEAAMVRSQELVKYFSHDRPDGRSCFTALDEQGVTYDRAGENIALGFNSPAAVMNGWMNSSGHRANILNADYEQMGIGYIKSGGVGYWVQLFIRRK